MSVILHKLTDFSTSSWYGLRGAGQVHQAVYEVDELRACMEDEYDIERYAPSIDALDTSLRQLYDDIISGSYGGAGQGGDLPFMKIVNRFDRDIPFRGLLETINAAHRKGWR